ncbi:hypothetical protein HD806DRAFT_548080 [Xylariaceae sp. AK1471]|nr:hypothetical protein HD806DRAFT_548080 [Xylariaceae sp. AK1471]
MDLESLKPIPLQQSTQKFEVRDHSRWQSNHFHHWHLGSVMQAGASCARRLVFLLESSSGSRVEEQTLNSSMKDQEHSGLAIEFPRLDPKFYHDPVPDARTSDRPQNGVEFDRLFTSEFYQRKNLHGPRSWQAVLLNRWLGPSPFGLVSGGHTSSDDADMIQLILERDRIEVDESRWFQFLRRYRWYDLVNDPNYPTLPAPRGGPWSVDNPKIWNALRVCIELVDRIFRTLIFDRHSAMWDDIGPYALSSPDYKAPVLLSAEMEREIATVENRQPYLSELEYVPEIDKADALGRKLEELCYGMAWSFFTEDDPGNTCGLTWKLDGGSVTCLPTELIRRLYEGDLTPAERCLIQYEISITIVHEIMHAIIHRRYSLLNALIPPAPGAPTPLYPEPFIDFDPVAEIGEAMEQRLFGGRTILCPSAAGIPMNCILVHWPTALLQGGHRNHNDYRLQDNTPITIELTPAMEAARLFSSSFWNDPNLPRKSDNFFHRMSLFQSKSYPNPMWPSYGPPDVWDEVYVDRTRQHQWRYHDQAAVAAWVDRSTVWNYDRRDWYDSHLQRWATTPWGLSIVRNRIDRFDDCFKKKDEVGCCRHAMLMGVNANGHPMDWRHMNRFLNAMPTKFRLRNHWVFFTIGLLMQAALPIKTQDVEVEDKTGYVQRFTVRASVRAREALQSGWDPLHAEIYLSNPYDGELEDVTREANVLYDPFVQPPFDPYGTPVPDPTQMGYLDLADKILDYMWRWEAVVSGPWYRTMVRFSRDLRRQRQELIDEYPAFHTSLWAKSWAFSIPEYDPEDLNWLQWDKTAQAWKSSTYTPDWVRQ